MEIWIVVAVAAVAVIALVAIATLVTKSRQRKAAKQTTQLREGFGPEYAKAVGDKGRAGAEKDLLKRQEQAGLFPVRALSDVEVARYNESWTATQAQFVDDPGAALTAADRVLVEMIGARGYPTAQFEQGASALSVDHPRAVQDYRGAHEVMLRNQRNPGSTDDLRAAMVQYRAVFTELMDSPMAPASVHAA